jgi:uncharacterized alkaline shock family protein YloU
MQPVPSSQAQPDTAPHSQRRGMIEVSPQAIATVAGRAVTETYGVVGIAGKHLRFGAAEILPPERYAHGIEVRIVGERIAIDLYLIVEYGLRISEVAHNAMLNVKFAVERVLDLPVVQVNVIVQGLRIGDANG